MRFKSLVSVIAVFVIAISATGAFAQRAPNTREVGSILRSLGSKIDDLKYSLRYGLRETADGDTLDNDVLELDRQVRSFQSNYSQRRENGDDVLDVLNAAKRISDFLESNRVNNTVQKDWTDVRTLLDRLASVYSVNWDWQNGGSVNRNYPVSGNRNYPMSNNALTGTYRLDASRSEKVGDVIDGLGVSDSQRSDLEDKLTATDEVAIEVRGYLVTIASSQDSPVTLTADGRTRNVGANQMRASLNGDQLTVSSLGGGNDFTITFAAEDGGRELKVTRRVTTDYLSETVFADSYYTKTDSVARLDIDTNPAPTSVSNNTTYSSNDPTDDPNAPTTRAPRTGTFIVPNGTMITGILENDISTKISQNNDRFRLTVQAPNEYRGAVVEGYVSGLNRSGKVSGRSQITFNFETIRLRSGETYDFAGFLQSITDQNGKTIKIDTEGTAKGDSQTKETVKRGGIGAGAGALIGAILGGAKGAAIGAIIGGSAGAGSVVVQGKDDLELKQGSSLTIQSSAPNQ